MNSEDKTVLGLLQRECIIGITGIFTVDRDGVPPNYRTCGAVQVRDKPLTEPKRLTLDTLRKRGPAIGADKIKIEVAVKMSDPLEQFKAPLLGSTFKLNTRSLLDRLQQRIGCFGLLGCRTKRCCFLKDNNSRRKNMVFRAGKSG